MRRHLLATFAAYLPAGTLPLLAAGAPGGPLDPAALVVPFCAGFALGFLGWGRAADRWDPHAVVRLGLLLTAAAGVLVALAPGEAWVIAARALQGLAAAAVPPAVQAILAHDAEEHRTGSALSGMMLAVAAAVLVGPALAPVSPDWTTAALACAAIPALAAIPRWTANAGQRPRFATHRAAFADPAGVRAGQVVAALVLAGHWTVLTRLAESPGSESVGALTVVAGLPLVVVAARAADLRGPRLTMTVTLTAGALGFVLAAAAQSAAAFALSAGVGLAVYWAYLPVVATQVQRSAGERARGRAAGGLYASMWMSAALAGAIASLAPGWREVLLGAGIAWAAAAVVAARGFLEASRACPQPSPP